MGKQLLEIIANEWPVIVAAVAGFIVSFFLYLKAKMDSKTEKLRLETENIKLEEIIAAGSYVLCPGCGKKIFLQDTKIYTGGQRDEK